MDGNQIAPVQWLDEQTLLFSVLVPPTSAVDTIPAADGVGRRYLVTWDVQTGQLHQVANYDARHELSFAQLDP